MRFLASFAALGLAFAVSGCGSTSSSTGSIFSGGSLSKPSVVLVGDFSVAPDSVALDSSMAAKLQRDMRGQSPAAMRVEVARNVNTVIGETVIARLREAGLPAQAGSGELALSGESTLAVGGRIKRVDQGNRMQRNLIGFGAGKSQVSAEVHVAYHSSAGKQDVLNFTAQAESSRRPGGAVAAPIGAAARGAMAVGASVGGSLAADKLSADVAAHARSLGNEIANRIIAWSAQQGWVAQPDA